MFKVKQGRKWLKTKFQGRMVSEEAQPERGIVIVCPPLHLIVPVNSRHKTDLHIQGSPTNFRRAEMTLGTDCTGQPMLVEQAREDAQSLYHANQSETFINPVDVGRK